MKFSPSNFYIGLIDLFAILLPGAIVSLIIYHTDWLGIKSWLVFPQENNEFYVSFLFLLAAYLVGHIVSQVSAYLDKWVYDKLNGTLVFKEEKHRRNVEQVKTIRQEVYQDYTEGKHLNNFEWSVNKLLKELPEVVAEIERYTADSKFFRSLLLIFPLLTGILWSQSKWQLGWLCLGLTVFSAIRYFHKRRKATETAYKGVIFLELMNQKKGDFREIDKPVPTIAPKSFRSNDNPNFKAREGQIKFLQTGFSGQVSHIEIPPKAQWTTIIPTTENEVWCCLEGRGVMAFPETDNTSKTVLVSNASVPMPKGKKVEINNDGDGPLMLVSISLK
jgi:mannose-6-phosphate isomerase-like protein (cupin superfamily)